MTEESLPYIVDTTTEEPEPIEVTISAENMDALHAEAKRQGVTIDQVLEALLQTLSK